MRTHKYKEMSALENSSIEKAKEALDLVSTISPIKCGKKHE